ncbi:MAG TPA: CHAT domain-containing protein [Kofleriaceae bacterium]
MSEPCSDLVRFADDELDPERAAAFRAHLPTCAACRTGLLEAIQLDARLSTLTPSANPEPPVEPAVEPPIASPIAPPPVARAATAIAKPKRRYRFAALGGGALAPIAALAVYLITRPVEPDPRIVFAELKTRPYDVRFAYADAAGYRPIREPMRGAGDPASERIPYAALAAFERHHDGHALAIARASNGDKPADVAVQLRGLEQTPSVRSDRAAIELLTTSKDNIEPILTELEALRGSADPAVARAARWNYAILLSRLDLPLSAAQAFQAIAGDHEPGWGDEARTRAEAEDRHGRDLQPKWQRAYQASQALVNAGTLVPATLVQEVPGVMRAQFYNAVRTAPSRERVLALAPMAAELDRLGGQPILSNYVQRVAKLDFHRRAPLAGAYAQLLQHGRLTPELERELTTPDPSSDVSDIAMGAMVELDAVPDHLEAFRRMTKQAGDPWFELVLAMAEATVDSQRGNWLEAEARLRKAEELCSPAVAYQCLTRAHQLAVLYQDLHRAPEAIEVLHKAVGIAFGAGEWRKYRQLLWRLADVERLHSSTATARAYANEVLRMADGCDYGSQAYRTLTGAALLDVDGRAARQSFEAAQRCGPPTLVAANYLADIGRLDPQPDDLKRLQGWLGTLRASGSLTAAQRVLADEIEGRLLIEHDRAAGTALLQRAIAGAATLPRDVEADKARAGAYSVLVFDAARQGDHGRVVTLVAEELGLPPPGACAVGMVAEDERAVVVVRDAGGKDHAAYDPARGPRAGAPAVSAELAQKLDGCAHVQVMAQASLQGRPRVLPPRLPWSYATGVSRSGSPRSQEPTEAQSLVVTDVKPPADLHLPTLSAQMPATPSTVLSGPAATPTQVLAKMRDASEIQFHTHALVDMGVSDASYLVLSPGPDGRYALTAEAIRDAELRGRPIVVLAACHSAQGALYQHAPWSLPHAFLGVGARAVFAAATEIPDRESGLFFTRVLARIRGGADPAAALRDERVAALTSNTSSWVADVILFE